MCRLAVAAVALAGACTGEVPHGQDPPKVAEPPVQAPSIPPAKPTRGDFDEVHDWNGVTLEMTCDEAAEQLEARDIAYRHSRIRRYPRRRDGKRLVHSNEPVLLVDADDGRWSIRCTTSKYVLRVRFHSEPFERRADADAIVNRVLARYGAPDHELDHGDVEQRIWSNDTWHVDLTVSHSPEPPLWRVTQSFRRGAYQPR